MKCPRSRRLGTTPPSWTRIGTASNSTAAPSSRLAGLTRIRSAAVSLNWMMPPGTRQPGPIELVAPPGEQRSSATVLDQQVDVDERRVRAEKEKQLLGRPSVLASSWLSSSRISSAKLGARTLEELDNWMDQRRRPLGSRPHSGKVSSTPVRDPCRCALLDFRPSFGHAAAKAQCRHR